MTFNELIKIASMHIYNPAVAEMLLATSGGTIYEHIIINKIASILIENECNIKQFAHEFQGKIHLIDQTMNYCNNTTYFTSNFNRFSDFYIQNTDIGLFESWQLKFKYNSLSMHKLINLCEKYISLKDNIDNKLLVDIS